MDLDGAHLAEEYMKDGFDQVSGWAHKGLIHLLLAIHSFQLNHGIAGGACEIGVHHGKLFLLLKNLKSRGRSVAIDVFEQEHLNIDGSGRGAINLFKQNCERLAPRYQSTEILTADSLGLNAGQIRGEQGFSIFSIDGGHTEQHTYNDYLLAEQSIASGGVILVDDYYNARWPGVHIGINRVFGQGFPTCAPLCFMFGKLVFVGVSWHRLMLDFLKDYFRHHYLDVALKPIQMFGWDCIFLPSNLDGKNADCRIPLEKPTSARSLFFSPSCSAKGWIHPWHDHLWTHGRRASLSCWIGDDEEVEVTLHCSAVMDSGPNKITVATDDVSLETSPAPSEEIKNRSQPVEIKLTTTPKNGVIKLVIESEYPFKAEASLPEAGYLLGVKLSGLQIDRKLDARGAQIKEATKGLAD